MSENVFDLNAWLRRIGYDGPRAPDLTTLRAVIIHQSHHVPFENVDVLLGRTPRLDLASLQRKLVTEARGGYCFELNALLKAGLTAMGFQVTGLIARVILGGDMAAERPASHMMNRVDLPEGAFLADVGFGNLTPTAPLRLEPNLEQTTPHETMRLVPEGAELVLQAQLGGEWRNLYRLSLTPPLPVDYEVANWFTATHPGSPFVPNVVASRPGEGGVRHTLFNGRVTLRRPGQAPERHQLESPAAWGPALREMFGLTLTGDDLAGVLAALTRHGTLGQAHPFFD